MENGGQGDQLMAIAEVRRGAGKFSVVVGAEDGSVELEISDIPDPS